MCAVRPGVCVCVCVMVHGAGTCDDGLWRHQTPYAGMENLEVAVRVANRETFRLPVPAGCPPVRGAPCRIRVVPRPHRRDRCSPSCSPTAGAPTRSCAPTSARSSAVCARVQCARVIARAGGAAVGRVAPGFAHAARRPRAAAATGALEPRAGRAATDMTNLTCSVTAELRVFVRVNVRVGSTSRVRAECHASRKLRTCGAMGMR